MTGHVAIPAVDLERSKQFYATLGFTVGTRWERPEWNLVGCFMTHDSGMTIELIVHPNNASIRFPDTVEALHVAVPVENLERVLELLEPLGSQVIRPITEGVTVKRLAFVRDPAGFSVEVFEPR